MLTIPTAKVFEPLTETFTLKCGDTLRVLRVSIPTSRLRRSKVWLSEKKPGS